MLNRKYQSKQFSDEQIEEMFDQIKNAPPDADAIDPEARSRAIRAAIKLTDNPSDSAALDEFIEAVRAADPILRRLPDED